MFSWIIAVVWLLAGTVAFRHLGYSINERYLKGHEYQRICGRCVCSKCGDNALSHYHDPCLGGQWTGMHGEAIVSALWWAYPMLLVTLAFLPLRHAYRKSEFKFFKPAPEIRSLSERREEKRERQRIELENKRLERERKIAELESENERLGNIIDSIYEKDST